MRGLTCLESHYEVHRGVLQATHVLFALTFAENLFQSRASGDSHIRVAVCVEINTRGEMTLMPRRMLAVFFRRFFDAQIGQVSDVCEQALI